jgi:tetratricopeptide (TPR) repeat protein
MKCPRTAFPIALLALLSLAGCETSPEERLDEQNLAWHREYALKLYDDNQLDAAENQVALGLEIEPDDERLRLIQARILLKRGSANDVQAAEAILREYADDEHFVANVGLAEALERKGVLFWESAVEVESGRRATEAADPAKRAAELRERAGEYWQQSTELYEKSLAIKPDYIQAINGLQRVWALRGDARRSVEYSERLLALADTEIAFWRAELQRPDIRADYEDQLRRRVSASARLLVATHVAASTSLVALGKREDALSHLAAALELDPARAEVYSRRAQLRCDMNDRRGAAEDLREFLKRSSLPLDHPDMARAFALLEECEKAIGVGSKP